MSSLHFSSFRNNNNTTRKSRSKDSIKFDKLKESLHKGTESDDEDDDLPDLPPGGQACHHSGLGCVPIATVIDDDAEHSSSATWWLSSFRVGVCDHSNSDE